MMSQCYAAAVGSVARVRPVQGPSFACILERSSTRSIMESGGEEDERRPVIMKSCEPCHKRGLKVGQRSHHGPFVLGLMAVFPNELNFVSSFLNKHLRSVCLLQDGSTHRLR